MNWKSGMNMFVPIWIVKLQWTELVRTVHVGCSLKSCLRVQQQTEISYVRFGCVKSTLPSVSCLLRNCKTFVDTTNYTVIFLLAQGGEYYMGHLNRTVCMVQCQSKSIFLCDSGQKLRLFLLIHPNQTSVMLRLVLFFMLIKGSQWDHIERYQYWAEATYLWSFTLW